MNATSVEIKRKRTEILNSTFFIDMFTAVVQRWKRRPQQATNQIDGVLVGASL